MITKPNFALACLIVVLLVPMLYQCIVLWIEYYDEPATTNIDIRNNNQSSFLSKLQFCFAENNMMNFSRAKSIGLNESHQYYLQTYFITPNQTKFLTPDFFNDFPNQTSWDAHLQRLFAAWDKIELDIIWIAGTVLNSSNPMEFWNMNQPNNIAPVRFNDPNFNVSMIVGPYTPQSSWEICYDIPSSPMPEINNYVQFNFKLSVNRKNMVGTTFATFSPYIGGGVVFDSEESIPINYDTDSTKYMTRLENWYIVGSKKWTAMNKRNSYCIEDQEVLLCFIVRLA